MNTWIVNANSRITHVSTSCFQNEDLLSQRGMVMIIIYYLALFNTTNISCLILIAAGSPQNIHQYLNVIDDRVAASLNQCTFSSQRRQQKASVSALSRPADKAPFLCGARAPPEGPELTVHREKPKLLVIRKAAIW